MTQPISKQKRPKSLAAFRDVEMVLSTVKRIGKFPAEYRETSPNRAAVWRHRAHSYRTAIRRNQEIIYGSEPGTGISEYDDLIFRIKGSVIIIDEHQPTGQLVIAGKETDIDPFDSKAVADDQFDLDKLLDEENDHE
jgi:hypothetical protein